MPANKVKLSKKEKKDTVRATILVLLVLTILISAISTWYVLDMINSVKQQYAAQPAVSYGQISVGIINPNEKPATSIATGKVVLSIK